MLKVERLELRHGDILALGGRLACRRMSGDCSSLFRLAAQPGAADLAPLGGMTMLERQ